MSQNDTVSIPYVSIAPSKIVLYSKREGLLRKRSSFEYLNELNLRMNQQSGFVSSKAEKKIRNGIDWLIYLSNDKTVRSNKSGNNFNYKLAFITLTLSSTQKHSDSEIKEKLLNQFLIEIKQKWNVERYLWRAEAQNNDNIHFHILLDKFIPYAWIRSAWNRIQNKLNYVDGFRNKQYRKYKKGFFANHEIIKKTSIKKQMERYKAGLKGNWSNPNSTDIHSIKHVRKLGTYLSKYCTKNPTNLKKADVSLSPNRYYKATAKHEIRGIEGNLWNLSNSLSRMKNMIEICDNELSDELNQILDENWESYKHYDYCSIVYISVNKIKRFGAGRLFSLFDEHVKLTA